MKGDGASVEGVGEAILELGESGGEEDQLPGEGNEDPPKELKRKFEEEDEGGQMADVVQRAARSSLESRQASPQSMPHGVVDRLNKCKG